MKREQPLGAADAPPVAQRTNSSTAASNDSVRASTSSRSAFQDANPCSRAITDCASCSARSSAPSSAAGMFANAGSAAKRSSAAAVLRLRRMQQRLGLLLQLFEIGTIG